MPSECINQTTCGLSQNIHVDNVKYINACDIFRKDRNHEAGGVAMFIKTALNTKIRCDLVNSRLIRNNLC